MSRDILTLIGTDAVKNLIAIAKGKLLCFDAHLDSIEDYVYGLDDKVDKCDAMRAQVVGEG